MKSIHKQKKIVIVNVGWKELMKIHARRVSIVKSSQALVPQKIHILSVLELLDAIRLNNIIYIYNFIDLKCIELLLSASQEHTVRVPSNIQDIILMSLMGKKQLFSPTIVLRDFKPDSQQIPYFYFTVLATGSKYGWCFWRPLHI